MLKHLRISLIAITIVFISGNLAAHTDPSVSAEDALKFLKEGNKHFVHGRLRSVDHKARRAKLADGQQPFAIILTCSDSRVPPEFVFDQPLGKLFTVRVAGNVSDSVGLGSMEYAAEHLGSRLIVVLGHSSCGAVKASLSDGVLPPNIASITNKIAPAVSRARSSNSNDPALLDRAIEENVREQMKNITDHSDSIRSMVQNHSLEILGGVYDLATGKVKWLTE